MTVRIRLPTVLTRAVEYLSASGEGSPVSSRSTSCGCSRLCFCFGGRGEFGMWEPMQLGPSSRLWVSHSPRRTSVAFPPPFSERPRTKPGIEATLCPIWSRVPLSPNPVDLREESDWRYLQLSDPWPDLELFRTLPFDYTVHDPKYEDASLICSHHQSAKSKGQAPACLPCLPGRGSSL